MVDLCVLLRVNEPDPRVDRDLPQRRVEVLAGGEGAANPAVLYFFLKKIVIICGNLRKGFNLPCPSSPYCPVRPLRSQWGRRRSTQKMGANSHFSSGKLKEDFNYFKMQLFLTSFSATMTEEETRIIVVTR